ncbi:MULTISPECIES: RagB/SusD family nutrient uptake outer membrane protein [Flavobacteriaceae]|uniref:RagB/SusD family nutrient uptake outer membrane protein n=1 Tax=Flavobacteriaceae TaxID=49546 RepID=UPI00149174DB|nr:MULTISPECIES: RagB/SusD family nutrient uptake outer membrane protein [Allomuricauda]MDC6366253.1 RagB/SusD family nutrient uptake outer membrane protein [Muricauda sp. AC10]
MISLFNTDKFVKRNFLFPILALFIISLSSCEDDFLNESPPSSLNNEGTLTTKDGFEAYLIGLVRNAREEYSKYDNNFFITNFPGTDVGSDAGAEYFTYRNWVSYLTPITSEVGNNWDWAYTQMIANANTIIEYAEKPELADIFADEAEKNAIIAEARFFRGYTYNFLANLYGGVPIVDKVEGTPKFDYVRASRAQVYEFAKDDLVYASQWLPETTDQEGRIVKAAADHLLSEVYISLNDYTNAIASASDVIDSDLYHLMTERFGVNAGEPGDVYSDLFTTGNINRSSGNMESIYVWQFESYTSGGSGSAWGNQAPRNMHPFLTKITDPNGVSNIPTDELNRGVGRVRGTPYALYDIWTDPNDIRNSEYNFRRTFYYNNPESAFFGQEIPPSTVAEDTLRRMYPYPRKHEGTPWQGSNSNGRTSEDVYVFRLAETYLLRAEAYFRDGQSQNAADDINTIRARSNAAAITAGDVSLDYILDERARELMYEGRRRKTLIRMGVLVERVRQYGLFESGRETIQDYHNLWPIPQTAIDANIGAELEQNPGY